MTAQWRISLLSGLSLQREEQVITRFKYQKVGGLLAYLAYYSGRMHSREMLVDMFWPDSGPETGRNNLSVALSSLRHQLEPPGTPAGSVLRADRYSVGLNPAMVTTDVAAFEAALRAAERAAAKADRAQHLEHAVGLYSGRLLPAFYEEWIVPEQERLAGLFFDATTSLVGDLEKAGDFSGAIRYARQAVAVDPCREEAHERLMRLLAVAGQPGAALRQFKELERLLDEELGEEPSAPVRALARQIEKDAGLTAPIPPPTLSVRRPSRGRESLFPTTDQPTTVTFLMSDIEGSTRQWEQAGEPFKEALRLHYTSLRAVFSAMGGQEMKEAGDSFLVAFASARRAVECAVACQRSLSEQAWPAEVGPLKVRMAVHTGDLEQREGEWQGLALHRGSRILTAGHGGQILISDATAGLVRRDLPEEIRLADLGVYALRDVPGPERLYEAHYPGMPESGFPALVAEAGIAGHLPLQFTRFFGREQEIARLQVLVSGGVVSGTEPDDHPPLTTHHSPLITLTGPGGTGKTRLALEVADRLAQTYHGAIWFVALADIVDSGLIAGTILDALRVPRSPQREPLDQVVEYLSRQPSLMVLDNFEQLVEGGADLVQSLIERVPTLTVLVTSRQLLGLSAEREFPVGPLPTPHGPDTPEELTLYDSVRLFVDRAQAVMPHFQVSNHNAPAVAELCDRLEGIPLAIELAAARAQSLTPGQMLAQLDNRFDFLASKKRGIEERHRTLRAAVEWSYRLLSPEVQRFFSHLSVFRGGWDLEAAEAVCEEPLALDYLALLRDCSLLLTDDNGPRMRWRMLETLREYASERLAEAAEATAARKRHAEYYATLAEEARPELYGPRQTEWFDRLETEHDNVRASIDALRQDPMGGETGLRLSAAVSWFWYVRCHFAEGRKRYADCLAHPGAQTRTKARADALNGAGNLTDVQGDYEAARLLHEEALGIREEIDDKRGVAGSLNNLAIIAGAQGDFERGRSLLEKALKINRETGNRGWEATNLGNLGMVALHLGDLVAARAHSEASLAINEELGNTNGIAHYLDVLGTLALKQGDCERARPLLESALTLCRKTGNREREASTLSSLGTLAQMQRNLSAAQSYHVASLALFREIGVPLGIAAETGNLGKIAFLQGDPERARACHEEALAILRTLGDKSGLAVSLRNLATVLFELGEVEASQESLLESLRLCRQIGDRETSALGLETMAQWAQVEGKPKRAGRLLGAAERLREVIGCPMTVTDQVRQERLLAALMAIEDEDVFKREWETGRAMQWEQAVDYALEQTDAAG
jgi:predicted ATPase/DNA-binding SARP family transcriptional activator/class 3 adenylate cyclase